MVPQLKRCALYKWRHVCIAIAASSSLTIRHSKQMCAPLILPLLYDQNAVHKFQVTRTDP